MKDETETIKEEIIKAMLDLVKLEKSLNKFLEPPHILLRLPSSENEKINSAISNIRDSYWDLGDLLKLLGKKDIQR